MRSIVRLLLGTLTILAAATSVSAQLENDHENDPDFELYEKLRTAKPAPNPHPKRFYDDSESASVEQRRMVVLDSLTREVTLLDASPAFKSWEVLPRDRPYLGADMPPQPLIEEFPTKITPTPPSPRSNNMSFPRRTLHKLVMRYNVGGTNYYYSCTGWAAGSFHVVTAGHCVYSFDPDDDPGTSGDQWADEVWIFAAQGDVVEPFGPERWEVDRPYGEAKDVRIRSYTGWTDYENHSHDWAVITLNRRDGDRTGWMGRESDCADSLNFSGYPTETPYVPEDTVVQYYGYDSDNVDYCWINRIGLDAYVYGGHSGGPSWRYISATGDRYVEGIHSTSDRAGSSQDTRLTNGKRSDLNDWMSDDESARPPVARPDLIEYFFDGNTRKDLLTNSVAQGEALQVEYNVFNSGFASSGTFDVDFYLSTNTKITTSDHFIGSRSHSLNAWTYTNPTATLTIPVSVPTGFYYVGWIIGSGATEYSTANNRAVIADEVVNVLAEREIEVTSPNGGQIWESGENRSITWSRTNAGSTVSIAVSRNGGSSWSTIVSGTANDGSYTWSVTGPASSDCRVRVRSDDYPSVSDISDADFRIIDRRLTVTYPTNPVVWYTDTFVVINWTSTDAGANVGIDISRDGGMKWAPITESTANDGAYGWIVQGPLSSRCRIRVKSLSYVLLSDTSNADFTITERRVTVISPNGGESWSVGNTESITWTAWNVGSTVDIELSRDGGGTWSTIVSGTPQDGAYAWSVSGPQSDQCRVRIRSSSYAWVLDASDADFTVVDDSIFADGFESDDASAWSSAVGAVDIVTLMSGDGYDFSERTSGDVSHGDFYFLYQSGLSKFWANNSGMNGLVDLGVTTGSLESITVPTSGYYKYGVEAIHDHTYVALAADGEDDSYIIFRATAVSSTEATLAWVYVHRP
jgi:V8-like Glu-specific endopeptidase